MTMAELQQPRTLIHRVDGRDLRVLVDSPFVYLARDDVEAIAGVPPWGTGELLVVDDDQSIEIRGVAYIPLEAARTRATEDAAPDRAAAFLTWLDDELPHLTNPQILELAHKPASFANAYTVAGAADALATELSIRLGRDRLFDHMEALGWIERNDATAQWMITALPHNKDWLTIRAVNVGPRGAKTARRYLQVHVTPEGLVALAETLRPAEPTETSKPTPAPTLFD